MTADLLPCPHCGDVVDPQDIERNCTGVPYVGVSCPSCGASCFGSAMVLDQAEAMAFARWNHRAPIAAAPVVTGEGICLDTAQRVLDLFTAAMRQDCPALIAMRLAMQQVGVADTIATPPAASAVTDAMVDAFWAADDWGAIDSWPMGYERTRRCITAALAAAQGTT